MFVDTEPKENGEFACRWWAAWKTQLIHIGISRAGSRTVNFGPGSGSLSPDQHI